MSYDTLDFLIRAARDFEYALELLPADTAEHRTARGRIRESGRDILSRAKRLIAAQTVSETLSNPHLLDAVVKWMRGRQKAADLRQIADEFTGGNLVVAKRVVDQLEGLGFLVPIGRTRVKEWVLGFDWSDFDKEPVPEGRDFTEDARVS